MTVSPRLERFSANGVAVVFVALIVTAALIVNRQFAGFAAALGVLVAALLAWRKAPSVVIVVAAALTTAALPLIGVAGNPSTQVAGQ